MKNLLGSLMILVISGVADWLLLVPELQESFVGAKLTSGLWEWIVVGGSLFLVLFLLAFPIFLIIQAAVDYRTHQTPTV